VYGASRVSDARSVQACIFLAARSLEISFYASACVWCSVYLLGASHLGPIVQYTWTYSGQRSTRTYDTRPLRSSPHDSLKSDSLNGL